MRSAFVRIAALGLLVATAFLAGCDNNSPTEPTDCSSVTLTPSSFSFNATGGTGSIAVAIPAGCAWTAQAQASWIAISAGSSGSGAGTVSLAVAENTAESPRSGSLAVAGRTATVTQAGREPGPECTYALTPESVTVAKDGGPGTVTVTAPDGCAWTASSDAAWLAIVSGGAGSGTGTVNYSVTANRDAAVRDATLTVSDRTLAVTQEPDLGACTYAVAPVDFAPCMPAMEMTAAVTTQDVCPWTATPDASWMSVSEPSGVGSATVRFGVTANYDAPRLGLVLVRWPAPTAGQNLRVAQAGCMYAVTQSAFAVPTGGGSFSFDVFQQSDPNTCGGALQDRCVWSAVSDVSWIVVTTSLPRMGDDRVNFTVAVNTTGAGRSGSIRVRDQIVQISQQ
jgi:hypothetical protein